MTMIEIQARGVHQGCRTVSPNNLEGLFSHHTGRLRHSVQFSLIINERSKPIKTLLGDVIMQVANGIAEGMVAMVIIARHSGRDTSAVFNTMRGREGESLVPSNRV